MEDFVLYEDKDILVLNKQAGVIVNRSDTTRHEVTLQDLVEKHLGISYPAITRTKDAADGYPSVIEVFQGRSGIAHRLDKETSGIILVAKNPTSFEYLQKEFKEREVEKTYLALAHGDVIPRVGEVRVPVGRLEFNRMRFGVVAGGRESLTEYKVLQTFKNKSGICSLVELYPKTGRTHQIRVHLKHLNFPIVSDELYAGRKTARNDRKELGRLFLHAAGITFTHPTTGKRMSFLAPLPVELENYLRTLTPMEHFA